MKIAIVGTGYVGLVSAACLADFGHEVAAFDIDREKIERIKRGELPIYEPGLGALIEEQDLGDFGPLRWDASVIPPIVTRGVLIDLAGARDVVALPAYLLANAPEGALVLFLGAGSITSAAAELARELRAAVLS